MGRDDALDLLVRTACSMPWMPVTESTTDPTAHLDADERLNADAIDPLLLHADAAIDLISLCEGLLARRRAEPQNKALKLAEAQSAISSHDDAEQQFKTGLIEIVGKPGGKNGRFSYQQIRLFLTGHEAPKRGDRHLKEIWMLAKRLDCFPKRFDSFVDEDFCDAVDTYVRSEGLDSWQLRVLAPYATKLGKKKLASAVDS
jgi:hypothetical protein